MQNDECRMQNEEEITDETQRHGEEKREKKFSPAIVACGGEFPGFVLLRVSVSAQKTDRRVGSAHRWAKPTLQRNHLHIFRASRRLMSDSIVNAPPPASPARPERCEGGGPAVAGNVG
jgi:hypothetical protein